MFEHKGKADTRRELFGGKGSVEVYNLLGARQMPPFAAVLACTLSPSGSVGVHVQTEYPEIVMGISGRGIARVDGKSLALEAFDVVHLPLGSKLELENASADEPLHYLIIKAR